MASVKYTNDFIMLNNKYAHYANETLGIPLENLRNKYFVYAWVVD